ncbi:MAG: GntR family transcriptional regulator [Candidatus Omnitrophica bacterium]|nr:GntR family transcriptional regulator [Candidatus Omnitrophota bacterium]
MAKVDINSSVSLPAQIAQDIRAKITGGRLAADGKLPSEERLAKDYGVSRMTARQSLVELAAQGLIRRIPGKGTFVCGKNSAGENRETLTANPVMLIVPNLRNSFYYQIISGAEQFLAANGCSVILRSANDSPLKEREMLQKLQGMPVILVSGRYTKDNLGLIKKLKDELSLVVVDVSIPGLKADTVISDDRKGGFLAVEHLIELGHTNILHLAGPEEDSSADKRREGYADALEKYGIKYNPGYVRFTDWRMEEGYYEAKKFFLNAASREEVTAIFACNDEVAAGAYKALKELKITIPDEVALAGYGNMAIGKFMDIPLTTVNQSAEEMGKSAGKMILNRKSGRNKQDAAEEVLVPVKLVIRSSCGIKKVVQNTEGRRR